MAIRNIQPLYRRGNPSMPLGASPYHSRVESQELEFEGGISLDEPKGYQFIAFRPGFSLQASELNEMQEHFQMQLTLSIAMMHNWITSGTGTHWGEWSSDSSGSEGSVETPADVPRTGIGVGGGVDEFGVPSHNPAYAISGPGWKGATPLHPYHIPYQSGNEHGGPGPVDANFFVTTNTVRIDFYPGWWLVELRDWWNGDHGDTPNLVSGMKHWIYLDGSEDAGPAYSIDVPVGSDDNIDILVGLNLFADFYSCCPAEDSTDALPCDPDLADNANQGVPNPASCGASRYGIGVLGVGMAQPSSVGNWGEVNDEDSDFALKEKLSLVCKINPAENTVRYMNNLLLYQW